MFVILVFLIIYLCFLTIFTVYKILELEKDINTLYDSYVRELQKTYKVNVYKGGVLNG